MHRVHHSRLQPETDSNFSSVFSFWDRLAGTFRQRADPQGITFGLEGYDGEEWQSVRGLLRTPFVRSPEAARKRQTVDRARRRAGPAHTRRTPLL
jgi:sterol desaturase/sphingolipid hydroxylase (fatty acid hydroxylase superfamily)